MQLRMSVRTLHVVPESPVSGASRTIQHLGLPIGHLPVSHCSCCGDLCWNARREQYSF